MAREHFATNILRGRLLGLARGWGDGLGPRALLACPPGEQHDLGLLAFGVVLHRNGWRVDYCGPDTPVDDLAQTAEETHPGLTVLAAAVPERYQEQADGLARLAAVAPLVWPAPAPGPPRRRPWRPPWEPGCSSATRLPRPSGRISGDRWPRRVLPRLVRWPVAG